VKSLIENARFSNRDVVLLNHGHVMSSLSNIIDLLKSYLEKENFNAVTREQIQQFEQNLLQKLATCLLDYQHSCGA
jgi:hypothetical protein